MATADNANATPKSLYTDDTVIFLLMSQSARCARGFGDRNGKYTFAFTTRPKAEEFVRRAKAVGILSDVDLLCEITAGEFFGWKERGLTDSALAIDPDPGTLQHPLFFTSRHAGN